MFFVHLERWIVFSSFKVLFILLYVFVIACRYELFKKKKKNICTYIIVFFLFANKFYFRMSQNNAVLEMALVILNLFFYYFKHQTAKL